MPYVRRPLTFVREHLYRNHKRPITCVRCSMKFASESLLSEHLRAATLCSIRDAHFDGFDRDQESRLRSSRRHSQEPTGEAGTWKSIYAILFPDVSESAVPSPFAEPTLAFNERPKSPSGPGNSRPGSLSSIPVDFERTADDHNQDSSRARSNTQTSLHPSSAEGRRGHASRDSRSEEMSRYALAPLQTDVQGEYHRSTSEWILALSPASLSSETPLSGSGIIQPIRAVPPKDVVPSESGISAADSRSPNDGMSDTSEDLEMHRLQQEIDGVRKEAGIYHALLLHHQKAWSEEKSSFEKKILELEAAIDVMRIENNHQPKEKPTDPTTRYKEGLDRIGSHISQGSVHVSNEPVKFHDGQLRDLDQHPLDELMQDIDDDEDSSESESESETELSGEEKLLSEIVHHHRKRAFQELMQTAALDSSGPQAGPSGPSGNSGGDQGGNDSLGNGRSGKSKRGREGGYGGTGANNRDDNDEKDNAIPEPKRSKPNNGPRLACIFYQRAPHEHQRNACTGPGWSAIKGLR
jgi:hypothetical protein